MTLTKRFFQRVTVGLCWLVALSGTVGSVQAGEYAALRESLRARGMGGAFTAVANARLDTLDREAAVMRQVVEITLTYGNDDR